MVNADQFQFLSDILQGTAAVPGPNFAFEDNCHDRLYRAFLTIGKQRGAGPLDFAVLLRHVLRRESELQGNNNQTIRVRRTSNFPNQELWAQCGMLVLDQHERNVLLEAAPWRPSWLAATDVVSPESPTLREERRRTYEPVRGDPLLALVGLDDYQNPGQREALRGVINAPPGSTLVVNLPTGAGKSLCVQLPALAESTDYGVTLVIVPTTALAIDQERAMARFVQHPTAYFGDATDAGQKRRQEIRKRIREGSQQIVFTSPESALESLSTSLYAAARRGLLRMFAIDEVHMIDQWGEGFRPAFQELPGLRRGLLRAAPEEKFKTILMTGTLTESTLDILESLFGQPGPFEVVSAMQLRPEPSYWFARCDTEEVKRSRVLDALFHLPRPLILYTTLVEDAVRWGRIIRSLGAERLSVMTGDSSSRERIEVIDRWRRKEIDIVVATSAFGLGVDQADVRAVIHACVPETIDRFYQEVGRGGRDGAASLSLVIYGDDDESRAEGLNKRVSIGADRGRQRWERMFNSKQRLTEDRWSIKIDLAPGVSNVRDINMQNEQSNKWNIRTLTLMACAGIIKYDSEAPPNIEVSELAGDSAKDKTSDEDAFENSVEHQSYRVIRILDENHLQESTWTGVIENIRKKRLALGLESFRAMSEALKGRVCISQLLSGAYAIPVRGFGPPRKGVVVSRACGGCAYCREQGILPFAESLPTPRPAWHNYKFPIKASLQTLLGNERLMAVFYNRAQPKDEWLERLEDLTRWLVRQGVRNIVDSTNLLRGRIYNLDPTESIAFFFLDFEPITMPPGPTFIIHPKGVPVPSQYLRTNADSAPRILLIPENSADPVAGHRRLRDVFNGKSFGFTELNTILAL